MAFHPYIHVFPDSCYNHEFVPPSRFTVLSNCTYIDHSVSGPLGFNSFCSHFALRSLPPNSYKSIIQKVHQLLLIALVLPIYSFFFTLALLFFFTFHSRYSFLYRCSFVFSLSGLVPPSSHVLLRFTLFLPFSFPYRSLLPSLLLVSSRLFDS